MGYIITATPTGHKCIKKLSPIVRNHIKEVIEELRTNPLKGNPLKGEYVFLRSLHTVFRSTDYRIIYEVIAQGNEVRIHNVGPRENIYKRLKLQRIRRAA